MDSDTNETYSFFSSNNTSSAVYIFLMYPCYFLSYIRNDYKRNKEIFRVFLASLSFAVFLYAFDQLIDLIFAILYLFK